MLNTIIICGRMVRDPEYRMTQSQKGVANFTLAVERDFSAQGEKRESDFIDCVAWGRSAEFVKQYFSNGNIAIVCGRLQSREWTDKDGNKRRTWEIIADRVYFGESKKNTAQQSAFQEENDDGTLPF